MICIKTTEKYCNGDITKIENYDKAVNDTTQMYICHHRNEQYYTWIELKKLGLYFNCPPCELIFVTKSEHKQIHKTCAGYEEYIKKNSESHKNQIPWIKGKHHTQECKDELSKKLKEKPCYKNRGKVPWNKGLKGQQKMSTENKEKISKAIKNTKWYNDGKINVRAFECPEGFVPGRLSWKK